MSGIDFAKVFVYRGGAWYLFLRGIHMSGWHFVYFFMWHSHVWLALRIDSSHGIQMSGMFFTWYSHARGALCIHFYVAFACVRDNLCTFPRSIRMCVCVCVCRTLFAFWPLHESHMCVEHFACICASYPNVC